MRPLPILLCWLATFCLPLAAQDNGSKPKPKPGEPKAARTWTDPATGLMWAGMDNGSDLDWNRAMGYCKNLRVGGNAGWRLPGIEELQGIYDWRATASMILYGSPFPYHVKGGLTLTGWHWSATQNGAAEVWYFSFTNGQRHAAPRDSCYGERALCVRNAQK